VHGACGRCVRGKVGGAWVVCVGVCVVGVVACARVDGVVSLSLSLCSVFRVPCQTLGAGGGVTLSCLQDGPLVFSVTEKLFCDRHC